MISFDKTFFLGLYAFIRKIELSIHRRENLSDLHLYYKSSISEFDDVCKKLNSKIDELYVPNEINIIPPILAKRIYEKIFLKYKLRNKELFVLINLLADTKKLLVESKSNSKYSLNEARLLLRQYYDYILANRIDSKDKILLSKVEHLNQNNYVFFPNALLYGLQVKRSSGV